MGARRAFGPRPVCVGATVHLDPHVSLREIQRTLGIPKSASRYLRAVKYHPYHVILNQALTKQDHRQRLLFSYQWALQHIQNNGDFF